MYSETFTFWRETRVWIGACRRKTIPRSNFHLRSGIPGNPSVGTRLAHFFCHFSVTGCGFRAASSPALPKPLPQPVFDLKTNRPFNVFPPRWESRSPRYVILFTARVKRKKTSFRQEREHETSFKK